MLYQLLPFVVPFGLDQCWKNETVNDQIPFNYNQFFIAQLDDHCELIWISVTNIFPSVPCTRWHGNLAQQCTMGFAKLIGSWSWFNGMICCSLFWDCIILKFSQHCWNQLVPVAIVSFRYLLVCHPVFCRNRTEKKVQFCYVIETPQPLLSTKCTFPQKWPFLFLCDFGT